MWSSLVEYYRPATIDAALRLLSRRSPRTVPLAGGTWLVGQHNPQIEAVADLSALNLAYIRQSARRIRLGAMMTLQALIDSPYIHNIAGGFLSEAVQRSAPRAIRNVATLGGTIVVGNPSSQLCLALLALDAQVVIRTPVVRVVPLTEFFANQTACLPSAGILTEVIIPVQPARIGTAFAQVSRSPRDQPIVSAAAWVRRVGHVCRQARLALGGIAPKPVRLPEIEAMISYQRIDPELYAQLAATLRGMIHMTPDGKSSVEYRQEMVGIVVIRVLQKAWEQAEEG